MLNPLVSLALVPVLCWLPAPQDAPAGRRPGRSAEVGTRTVAFDGGCDLTQLTLGAATFGTPVRPSDLYGKVVVIRTWSG